jgi:hypothetical protein
MYVIEWVQLRGVSGAHLLEGLDQGLAARRCAPPVQSRLLLILMAQAWEKRLPGLIPGCSVTPQ